VTPADEPTALGRVALFGDVGGHSKQLRRSLIALGADAATLTLPRDLTVVQVGDLIHRGPDSPGAIAIARSAMTAQPRQWVQLAGNHESYYLTPPRFHWPERMREEDLETLYDWWRTRRMRVAAAVEVDDDPCRYLVTHAGLTEGFWRHFIGMPDGAVAAARALNGLVGRVHENWVYRPGVMLTGEVDHSAGPLWASAPDELLPSWTATSAPAPFHQVHGHSSTIDWVTGRRYGRPESVPGVKEDTLLRHATAVIDGRFVIGIDPGHGRRPAPSWGPLVLHNARVLR
jgi:hypothetical protein